MRCRVRLRYRRVPRIAVYSRESAVPARTIADPGDLSTAGEEPPMVFRWTPGLGSLPAIRKDSRPVTRPSRRARAVWLEHAYGSPECMLECACAACGRAMCAPGARNGHTCVYMREPGSSHNAPKTLCAACRGHLSPENAS